MHNDKNDINGNTTYDMTLRITAEQEMTHTVCFVCFVYDDGWSNDDKTEANDLCFCLFVV